MGCFLFSPSYVAFRDSRSPDRPVCQRVSYCVETSPPSQLPHQNRSPSLSLLSLFLSFILCPNSFRREWAAFLGTWYALRVFRSYFVEVAQHSNDLLMNLWWRKWSSRLIPPPSSLVKDQSSRYSRGREINSTFLKRNGTSLQEEN